MRQVREEREVRVPFETYKEPDLLEMPTFGDEDQYSYRWIRVMIRGEADYQNISRRMREGWTFVQVDDVPVELRGVQGPASPVHHQAQIEGCMRQGDLVLAKIPKSKAMAYKRHVEGKAAEMYGAFDRKILRDEETGAVLHNESSHRVTKGQVRFDD